LTVAQNLISFSASRGVAPRWNIVNTIEPPIAIWSGAQAIIRSAHQRVTCEQDLAEGQGLVCAKFSEFVNGLCPSDQAVFIWLDFRTY
jgi:hypothetical protein